MEFQEGAGRTRVARAARVAGIGLPEALHLLHRTTMSMAANQGAHMKLFVLLRSACVTAKSGVPPGFRQVHVAERGILASHPLPAAAMAC
jgi:hypothetical protein